MDLSSKSQRDVTKERQWRELLAKQQVSGLSKSAFCRQHGLSISAFWYWQTVIPKLDGANKHRTKAAPKRQLPAASIVNQNVPEFLEVRVSGEQAVAPMPPDFNSHIQIISPTGVIVRLPALLDTSVLLSVLEVMK